MVTQAPVHVQKLLAFLVETCPALLNVLGGTPAEVSLFNTKLHAVRMARQSEIKNPLGANFMVPMVGIVRKQNAKTLFFESTSSQLLISRLRKGGGSPVLHPGQTNAVAISAQNQALVAQQLKTQTTITISNPPEIGSFFGFKASDCNCRNRGCSKWHTYP